MTSVSITSALGTITASNNPGFDDVNGVRWHLVTSTGIWDSAPVRTNFTARPMAWGQYDGPVFPDKRVITVKLAVVSNNEPQRITAIRQAKGALADGSLGTLTVTDALGTYSTSIHVSDVTAVSMVGQSGFDVAYQFTAPDPRWLGDRQDITTTMAQSTGLGIPWRGAAGTGGAQWRGSAGTAGALWRGADGGSTFSGSVLLDNRTGTAKSDIEFTIRGPIENPLLITGTSRVRYQGSLGTGDVLVINTGTGAVRLNGVNRRSYMTNSDWFTVPPGQTLGVQFIGDVQNSTATCTAVSYVSYL